MTSLTTKKRWYAIESFRSRPQTRFFAAMTRKRGGCAATQLAPPTITAEVSILYELLFLLKSIHLWLCCCRTFIFAFTRLKIVDYVQGYASMVITLSFIDENAISVHSPVVVGCVENVSCRQFKSERFIQEWLAHWCIHSEPWTTEAVSVAIALWSSADISSNRPPMWQRESIVKIVRV